MAMNIIMLQRLDPLTFENVGGLYINIEHISAFIPNKRTWEGKTQFFTQILLSNGVQYLTPYNIQEIQEEIYELRLQAKKVL